MQRVKQLTLQNLSFKIAIAVTLFSVCFTNGWSAPEVSQSQNAPSTETVLWQKAPISIVLPVGVERWVSFPSKVILEGSLAPKLTQNLVQVLNDNGTLYFTAKKAFAPIQVPVALTQTGQTVLLKLSATANASTTSVTIKVPSNEVSSEGGNNIETSEKSANDTVNEAQPPNMPYATLFKFAIKTLYPQNDAIPQNLQIVRTPMYTTQSVPLVAGNRVFALPLASWRAGDEFITAVELVNHTRSQVSLNPEQFAGRWLAADFYRPNNDEAHVPYWTLLPRGSRFAQTTLLLISNAAFNIAFMANPDYPLTQSDMKP